MTNKEIANEIKKIRLERCKSLLQMSKLLKVASSTIFFSEAGKLGKNVLDKYNEIFGTNFQLDEKLCSKCGKEMTLNSRNKWRCKECYDLTWRRKQEFNQNPITYKTRLMICLAVYDKEPLEIVAKDLNRPIEQCEEILKECKKNGFYRKIIMRCR